MGTPTPSGDLDRSGPLRTFDSIADFSAAVGEAIGPGPWRQVEQDRVDLFADATDDHQWIHLDPVRAAAGPFGGTVAHGFLTLSLLPSFARELYEVHGVRMAVNYGLNRVRFPAPVRVGSQVRATMTIAEVKPVDGGVQVTSTVVVESDAGGKPVCVAESVSRLYEDGATA